LEIPAAHVTHDRDEALSIGDDLAVIVGGQLRQSGLAATVAAEPADPDVARLLGWTELGHGTASDGTARIGQLVLSGANVRDLHGPVQVFYRPEEVQLKPTAAEAGSAVGQLTAHVERIVRTRPLARISLTGHPPIAALMLRRDIDPLRFSPGDPVHVHLPPEGVRVFQTR
jgi:ABC-type Fe3+/spermidine/putrescine transport system ATPase subunit